MSQKLTEFQGVSITYSKDGRVRLKKEGCLCSNCRMELDEVLTFTVECGVEVESDPDGFLVQVWLLRETAPRSLKQACMEVSDAIQACRKDCLTRV